MPKRSNLSGMGSASFHPVALGLSQDLPVAYLRLV